MKTRTIRNIIFGMLIVGFVLLFAAIFRFDRICEIKLPPNTILYLAGALLVLSAVLVVLTIIIKESRMKKFFFLLTGLSALGVPVCIVLHNLVYGLCIYWFGKDFWGKCGDEAFFFILGLFVCPALFIIGSLGSIVFLIYGLKEKTPVDKQLS